MTLGMELLRRLGSSGIRLSLNDERRLVVDAPARSLTTALREEIRSHKLELISILDRMAERAALMEHEAGMSRDDADRIAIDEILHELPVARIPSAPMVADPVEMPEGVICPHCSSRQLEDDPGGMRCRRCGRLAWILNGRSIVRADYAKTDLRI